MNKYYFICALKSEPFRASIYQNFVSKQHPFVMQNENGTCADPDKSFVLISWKEITKEEYDLFISLNA